MKSASFNAILTIFLLALAGTSIAATPFGGTVKGFLPTPKSPIAKCQGKTIKNVGKLVKCLAKCHAARVTGALPDAVAQEACESNNAGKSVARSSRRRRRGSPAAPYASARPSSSEPALSA